MQKLDLCTCPRLQDHFASMGLNYDGLWGPALGDFLLEYVIDLVIFFFLMIKATWAPSLSSFIFHFLQLGPLIENITAFLKLNVSFFIMFLYNKISDSDNL